MDSPDCATPEPTTLLPRPGDKARLPTQPAGGNNTMTAILETIHSAHRLALVSGAITPALQQAISGVAAQDGAGNPNTETLLE